MSVHDAFRGSRHSLCVETAFVKTIGSVLSPPPFPVCCISGYVPGAGFCSPPRNITAILAMYSFVVKWFCDFLLPCWLLASGGTRLRCAFAYGSDTSGTNVATQFSTAGRQIPLHHLAARRLAATTKCWSSAKVFVRGTHARSIYRESVSLNQELAQGA